jgi:cysteine desulfurase
MPSHVLKAIGLSDEEALSSIRITIGHTNTEEEIDQAAEIITKLVERIRNED